jgi:hypothetical protein
MSIAYLKRSFACDFCSPTPAPPPDTPKCTCYYPCEEWWCPERSDFSDDEGPDYLDDFDD